MEKTTTSLASRLNDLLVEAGLEPVDAGTADRFADYCALLLRWNARMNLTAVRDEDGILSRHFVESIACARALPMGIGTLLDFGSGAGFPGVPIALCRQEIAVTIAESQGKKAAFLLEVVRTLGLSVAVHAGRGEALSGQYDCVTLRAVDRMAEAVVAGSDLVAAGGWLALMSTEKELGHLKGSAGAEFSWLPPRVMPGSESQVLALGRRAVSLPA